MEVGTTITFIVICKELEMFLCHSHFYSTQAPTIKEKAPSNIRYDLVDTQTKLFPKFPIFVKAMELPGIDLDLCWHVILDTTLLSPVLCGYTLLVAVFNAAVFCLFFVLCLVTGDPHKYRYSTKTCRQTQLSLIVHFVETTVGLYLHLKLFILSADFIDWRLMETCPTFYGVEDSDLKELAEAVQILQTGGQKEWSDDNLISVFDELTGTGNKPENTQMPSNSLVHIPCVFIII